MTGAIAEGQVVGGKYRLRQQLAEGGMGSVWLAHHEILDVEVAVKLMSTEIIGTELALARFEREAKASAQLKSNHIVRVHDYGVDDGTPFIVMERLEGEDLGKRLKRGGPMTIAALAPVLAQICKALEVAREAGIVHRDLKPSNVFLAREGDDEVAKLVDFGVARETKNKRVADKTSSGVVVGSPHHMSPEQAHGLDVDHRSDLWSLGVLVFEALTGKRPFQGDAMTAILIEVVSKPIPKAREIDPELPADIDRFFARALSRNVDRRFQRAKTMAAAFQAIARSESITPYLQETPQVATGREDATTPSGEVLAAPSSVGPDDRSGTQIGTLTAGVIADAGLDRRPRWWLWAAAAVAMAVGAFALGRSRDDAVPETSEASPHAAVRDEEPAAAPEPTTAPEPAIEPPVTTASASSTATPVRVQPPPPRAQPPAPKAPPPKAPPAAPKSPRIDPFTGLPVAN